VLQHIEPLHRIGEPGGEAGEGTLRMGHQPGARDPQGQRKVAAEPGDPSRCDLLTGDPIDPDQPAEQVDRLSLGQRAQSQVRGAVQGAQHPAARDQRRAAGARQQRAHLRLVGGVVEDHQHPAAGRDRPEPGRRLVDIGRRLGHPERTQ
jgi:hypothetical protein